MKKNLNIIADILTIIAIGLNVYLGFKNGFNVYSWIIIGLFTATLILNIVARK